MNSSELEIGKRELSPDCQQAPRLHGFALTSREVLGETTTNELCRIDLFFRFIVDEQQTPALGFHALAAEEGEHETMYALAYIDPSLLGLWVSEMNREQEEE